MGSVAEIRFDAPSQEPCPRPHARFIPAGPLPLLAALPVLGRAARRQVAASAPTATETLLRLADLAPDPASAESAEDTAPDVTTIVVPRRRLLSEKTSARLLFAGTVLLVLAALVPVIFQKKQRPPEPPSAKSVDTPAPYKPAEPGKPAEAKSAAAPATSPAEPLPRIIPPPGSAAAPGKGPFAAEQQATALGEPQLPAASAPPVNDAPYPTTYPTTYPSTGAPPVPSDYPATSPRAADGYPVVLPYPSTQTPAAALPPDSGASQPPPYPAASLVDRQMSLPPVPPRPTSPEPPTARLHGTIESPTFGTSP